MKKLNIGVIGVGRIGSMHARNLKYQVPNVNVFGIADVFEEAAQKVAKELEVPIVEKDYRRLFHLKKPPSLKVVMAKRFYHKSRYIC